MSFSASHPPFHKPEIALHGTDGARTLPELIEWHARYNPHYAFCVQAIKQGRNTSPTILTFSYVQLKHAILRCSEWLEVNITESKAGWKNDDIIVKGPPVALLVDSDVGLLIHEFSLIALGIPVLLLSARLSPAAIHHLLVSTAARAIIVSPRLKNTAIAALALFQSVEEQPALFSQVSYDSYSGLDLEDRFVDRTICKQGHYLGDNDRDVLILHSSGTTGLPKPIHVSHKYLLCFTVCHNFSSDEEAQCLNLSLLPLYHGYGLVAPGLSLGVGRTFCMPPTSTIPTGASVVELLSAVGAHSLMSVPSILEEITFLPGDKGVPALVPLQFVAFGGGPLKSSVGEKLATGGVKLLNHYGATEVGPLAPIFVPQKDYNWRYFRLRKDMNLRLESAPASEDRVQRYTLVTHPFGWSTEFRIQDKLIASPQNPMSDFTVEGRNDDLIVLVSGEKVVPLILETLLSESELVTAAIAFGEGRFELGVIVQPSSPVPADKFDDFKSSIWPIILEAGNRMDAHAQISSMDAIIVLPHGKVLPRSDKGSIMRREVYSVFEDEIAKAYRNIEVSASGALAHPLNMDTLEHDLKKMIQAGLSWRIPDQEWGPNDDFFELGMDSLQAIQLRRCLLSSLPKSKDFVSKEQIGNDFVYQHPSLTEMAHALRASNGAAESESSRRDLIGEFVDMYSLKGEDVVLLTGSTGSLGTYLLAHLASLPAVARVICINRHGSDPNPYERQFRSCESKSVVLSKQQRSKIEVIETNLALPLLGLSEAQYAHVRGRVTHVLHNAWPMDFKRKLPSFKLQFQTLNNLLGLLQDVRKSRPQIKPRLLMVSSISVMGQYPRVKGEHLVPEIPVHDYAWTPSIGYTEAKLVCENILRKAADDFATEMEVSYVRIGQISGSTTNGFWNTDEHLAALVKSSQYIGALPDLESTCSWIPVDSAAQCLSELLLSPNPPSLTYHLENPTQQPWGDTLNIFASKLNTPTSTIQSLPFDTWLEKVCDATTKEDTTEQSKNPAKMLANFFQRDFRTMTCGNIILDMQKAMGMSPTLRMMGAVGPETISSYVEYWKGIGFLE